MQRKITPTIMLGAWVCRRLYPHDRSIIMEIQALVKAGKVQRIKSTAALKTSNPPLSPGLKRCRTVSVNCGALTTLCLDLFPLLQPTPHISDLYSRRIN